MKKTGSHYDLGIALSYLLATGQIKEFSSREKIFLGELALDGRLRPVSGALNITERAFRAGFLEIFLPAENANEAAAIGNIRVVPIRTLAEAIAILEKMEPMPRATYHESEYIREETSVDLSEIVGQENAKRAMLVAVAGGHNILLVGPPGVGKSVMAHAFADALPPLGPEEAVEVTKIWSAAGLSENELIKRPPFRAPHHTTSVMALIGGGSDPKPGEISLAHRGMLFLDELPEFQRNALESLRQPLESGELKIARTRRTISLPCSFSLIAAMNPCPCGYYGDTDGMCRCSAYEVLKYQKKISGPLLERIDLQVRVGRVDLRTSGPAGEGTREMSRRIERAKEVQNARFADPFKKNARMKPREIGKFVRLDRRAISFLETIADGRFSPRTYHRLLKTARTIADLEGNSEVSAEHLAEAYGYRLKER